MKKILFLLFVIDLTFSTNLHAQIITTVAGNGYWSFGGDGGPATAGALWEPHNVAFDGGGNLYIAEANQRIRKVSVSGIISTIAGGGSVYADGVPATNTTLGGVWGVAIDGSGNIYIAEAYCIRKINTSGIITRIAGNGIGGYSGDGGQATNAKINVPFNVTVDGSGNIYIADTYNNRVRRISTSGIISTIAGNGTAGFSGDGGPATAAKIAQPHGVAVDGSGNIYIADWNSRIRKVSTTGIINTVAGGGSLSGDSIPATSAAMGLPYGVTTDGVGNLFISTINSVYKVNTSGILNRIAGFGSTLLGDGGPATMANIFGLGGLVVDGSGNVLFAEEYKNRIRKISPSGIISTYAGGGKSALGDGGPATAGELYSPFDLAVDGSGNIFIADFYNNRIRKVTTSGIINTYAGSGLMGVLCGEFSGDGGPATDSKLNGPRSVDVDVSGNVYILDNRRIRKINVSGIITTIAGNDTAGFSGDGGPATNAKLFGGSFSFVVDGGGNVFFGDSSRIRKISASGIITTIAGNGLYGYSGDGGPATAAKIHIPSGLAIDGSGNVFFGDSSRIRKISASGIITTIAGNGLYGYSGDGGPATAAKIAPIDLAVDPGGNVYISGLGRIRKINTSGIINTVAGTGINGFSGDGGPATAANMSNEAITIDGGGNVYFLDNRRRVRKVSGISIAPSPITGVNHVCVGSTTTLNSSPPGGIWTSNNNAIATIGSLTGIVLGQSAGVTTITYTVGSSYAVLNVTVYTTPSTIVPSTATVCIGGTLTLFDSVGGGIWASSAPTKATVVGGVVNGIASGVATISYTIGTCYKTATVTVSATSSAPIANFTTGVTTIPVGGNITPVNSSTGCPPPTYVWAVAPSGGVSISSVTATNPTITFSIPGIYVVKLTATNINGNNSFTKTIIVNSASSLISISNVIHDNTTFNDSRLLWSGSEYSSPKIIKICADASTATHISFTNNTGINSENIRFWISSDNFGTNSDESGYFINYVRSGNTVTADLMHPKYLNSSYSLFRSDAIRIVDYTNPSSSIFTIPIQIYRAPVIMVHGLWGDFTSFEEMEGSLDGSGFYPPELTMKADYSATNAAYFFDNRFVVPTYINSILSTARNNNYSAGKVDVIGHSMGGILARYYIQSNAYAKKEDIHKLITINTPHSGSQLANLLMNTSSGLTGDVSNAVRAAVSPFANIYDGAVYDLAVGSNAMNFLNYSTLNNGIVPSHAIITTSPLESGNIFYLALSAAAPIKGMSVSALLDYLFYNEENDLVVSKSSQSGGLPSNATTFVSNQIHLGSPANTTVITTVKAALSINSSNSTFFAQNGFSPIVNNSAFKSTVPEPTTHLISGSLIINNPVFGQSFNPGYFVPLNITVKNGINRILLAAVINNDYNKVYTLDTLFTGGNIAYQVPLDAFGSIKFIAMGYDPNNLIDYDTVTVFVNRVSAIDSISFYPDTLKIQVDNINSISLRAHFHNGNKYTVSSLPNVNFQINDTDFAVQYYANLFRGKQIGTTTLTVKYLGLTKIIPVVVIPQDTTIHLFDCFYSLSDTVYNFDYQGGIHNVNVITSSPICAWKITNTNDWLHLNHTTQQIGYGDLTVSVDSFVDGSTRSGTFEAAGITYRVTQTGLQSSVNEKLVVYPNPSNDFIIIRGYKLENGNYTLTLRDMLGRQISKTNYVVSNNFIYTQIGLKELPVGIYSITVNSDNGSHVFKISKL